MSNKYRLAMDIPDWLQKLPPGKYFITDVEAKTKASRNNIYMRFEALEVKRIKVKKGKSWFNQYDWKGAQYYWLGVYEEKLKKLESKL